MRSWLTYDQAIQLTSKSVIAADEQTDLDDPFYQANIYLHTLSDNAGRFWDMSGPSIHG
jgi:hypothetical protein